LEELRRKIDNKVKRFESRLRLFLRKVNLIIRRKYILVSLIKVIVVANESAWIINIRPIAS
jgi:hypothetical protein